MASDQRYDGTNVGLSSGLVVDALSAPSNL